MHILHIRLIFPLKGTNFRQAKQEESETADQFVLRLFQLSENCEFGEAKEEHIRDQLIDKCRSHNQEIAGSKRNAYTPKGARDCKINGSG